MLIKIETTKKLNAQQAEQVSRLWNQEFPLKLSNRFEILLEGVSNYTHYLVKIEQEKISGWAVVFEKENERRFSVIVEEKYQCRGLGSALIESLKEVYDEFYGWVIDHNTDKKANNSFYQSPLPFYIKNGFEVLPHIRIDNEMLNAVKIKWTRSNPDKYKQ